MLGIIRGNVPMLFLTFGITPELFHVILNVGNNTGNCSHVILNIGNYMGKCSHIILSVEIRKKATFFPIKKKQLLHLGSQQLLKNIPKVELHVSVFSQLLSIFPFNSQLGILKSFLCSSSNLKSEYGSYDFEIITSFKRAT